VFGHGSSCLGSSSVGAGGLFAAGFDGVAVAADGLAVGFVVDVCGVPTEAGGFSVGDDVVGFVGLAGAAGVAELAFAVSCEDASGGGGGEAATLPGPGCGAPGFTHPTPPVAWFSRGPLVAVGVGHRPRTSSR